MDDRNSALRVDNLGKRYMIGAAQARYRTLRESLTQSLSAPLRRLKHRGSSTGRVSPFWALKGATFDVDPGEVVGVIGSNGAGKSTLLKLLSRITPPTEGRIKMTGRVGSLLEVGTGFHPELSGRENIYLSGAILGMSRREIRNRFDEIVEFAEVTEFLETPVKRYSSGMYVRLAFAVAAHLEPETLLVDEVLAVGDARFQKKCLGRMRDAAGEGRTVLFVSHNMSAVGALCSRTVHLASGRVVGDGPTRDVIAEYISQGAERGGEVTWPDPESAPASESVRLNAVRLRSEGEVTRETEIGSSLEVVLEYSVLKSRVASSASIHLLDAMGYVAFVSADECVERSAGVVRTTAVIPGNLLNDGLYSVTVFLLRDARHVEVRVDAAVSFVVHDAGAGRGPYLGRFIGAVRPTLAWHTESILGDPVSGDGT